jgi:uncharacterized protein YueI
MVITVLDTSYESNLYLKSDAISNYLYINKKRLPSNIVVAVTEYDMALGLKINKAVKDNNTFNTPTIKAVVWTPDIEVKESYPRKAIEEQLVIRANYILILSDNTGVNIDEETRYIKLCEKYNKPYDVISL